MGIMDMFKMFGLKDKHEPKAGKQDDPYRIPALNSVPISMSLEPMRRKKEGYLKKVQHDWFERQDLILEGV